MILDDRKMKLIKIADTIKNINERVGHIFPECCTKILYEMSEVRDLNFERFQEKFMILSSVWNLHVDTSQLKKIKVL